MILFRLSVSNLNVRITLLVTGKWSIVSPIPAANQLFAHWRHRIQTHQLIVALQCHSENDIWSCTFSYTPLDVCKCVWVCVCKMWHSHHCDFMAAGTFRIDGEIFQLSPDTLCLLWAQTSSGNKRASRVLHCRDTVTGLRPNSIQSSMSRDKVSARSHARKGKHFHDPVFLK